MDGLLERLHELEKRTRKMEGQLRAWRVLALLLGTCGLGYAWVLPGQAQPGPAPVNSVKAPFTVTGTNGLKLFEVTEFSEHAGSTTSTGSTGSDTQDTLLTLYRNGYPAAMYRTTGKFYKDAYDPADSYLNVVETWLYRYPRDAQGKADPTPYLATSTALTRAGGSIAVFSQQAKASTTPPVAARITAKRGVGGAVMLFDATGNEAKVIGSK